MPIRRDSTFQKEGGSDSKLLSSTFQSLEMEAETELQEIQNMLSIFDDVATSDKTWNAATVSSQYSQEGDFNQSQLSANDNSALLSKCDNL